VPTITALNHINIRSRPGIEYEIYAVGAFRADGEVIGVSERNYD
jgi:hypothetical protein